MCQRGQVHLTHSSQKETGPSWLTHCGTRPALIARDRPYEKSEVIQSQTPWSYERKPPSSPSSASVLDALSSSELPPPELVSTETLPSSVCSRAVSVTSAPLEPEVPSC